MKSFEICINIPTNGHILNFISFQYLPFYIKGALHFGLKIEQTKVVRQKQLSCKQCNYFT